MVQRAPSSKDFHIEMEGSWSRWAVLKKKGIQSPISLVANEMELLLRRVAGEALFLTVSQGSFKARGLSENSIKNSRINMSPLPMEEEFYRAGWNIWKEKNREGS